MPKQSADCLFKMIELKQGQLLEFERNIKSLGGSVLHTEQIKMGWRVIYYLETAPKFFSCD